MKKTSKQLAALAVLSLAASAVSADTIAYWRMEGDGVTTPTDGTFVQDTNGRTALQADGIPVIDSSGNGNTLYTWDNNSTGHQYRTNVPASTIPTTGASNSFSLQNNGGFPATFTWSAQSAPTKDVQQIAPSQWTIEASINATTLNNTYRAFVGRDGTGVASTNTNLAPLYFGITNQNRLRIEYVDAAGLFWSAVDPTPIVANTWYNVAARSDGSTLQLWKDSGAGYKLVASVDLSLSADSSMVLPGSAADGSAWGWTVGRGRYSTSQNQNDGHTDRWLGYIDEVRISDNALSPDTFLFAVANPNPRNIFWTGGSNGNVWDINTTTNFKETVANDSVFRQGDNVTFDDTAVSKDVIVSSQVVPGSLTINTAGTFSFTGSGAIAGDAAIVKSGTGRVIFAVPVAVAGDVTINGGVVQLGNGTADGTLGAGNIVNNGTIDINRATLIIMNNAISGTGGINVNSGGLAIGGNNTFEGPLTVGPVQVFIDNANAFGSPNGGTFVKAGGSIWLTTGNYNIAAEPLTIEGAGLAGDPTFSAPLRSGGTRTITWGGPVSLSGDAHIGVDGGSGFIFTNANALTTNNHNLLIKTNGFAEFRGAVNLGTSTVTKSSGRLTFTVPVDAPSATIASTDAATVQFNAPVSTTTPTVVARLGGLTVGANSSATMTTTDRAAAYQSVLVVSNLNLSFDTTTSAYLGKLDLANNDLVVKGTSETDVRAMVASWWAGGARTGAGLLTSAASELTTLAVVGNDNGNGGLLHAKFDGVDLVTSDVIVKYTYIGDLDLDGQVTGDDLTALVAGIRGNKTGWENGDTNYDGVVNGNDFANLLTVLRLQGTPLGNSFGGGTFTSGGAVPEPAMAMGLVASLPLVMRRKRR